MGPAMKAGFIGLGAMGQHMARNLHRAGLLAGVWNRTPSRAERFAAETGAPAFETPAALAAACGAVFTCVSADDDLLAVVDALQPGLAPGSLIIDCSTVAADTAREAASRLAAAGSDRGLDIDMVTGDEAPEGRPREGLGDGTERQGRAVHRLGREAAAVDRHGVPGTSARGGLRRLDAEQGPVRATLGGRLPPELAHDPREHVPIVGRIRARARRR